MSIINQLQYSFLLYFTAILLPLPYFRIADPSPEAEIDPWLKERGAPFPKLAARRLPLFALLTLPNKDKCKLLEKEFSLETFRWRFNMFTSKKL